MTKKTQEDNIVIEQLRWLIDQKLEHLKSFESRIIQILGVNGIFLAIIWASFSVDTNLSVLEIILVCAYFISIALQIVFLIIIGRPKQAEKQLEVKKSNHEIISNMEEYFSFLSIAIKRKASRTLWIYRIFVLQFCLILLKVFLLVLL